MASGEEATIDIDRLMETRMLIQASSGAGKSYAIRKLVEQMFGHVQIILIDIEGEFATLREKYDFILAGEGGDIQADPRTAEVLARKLLELEVSAIVDLYELKQQERKHFVRVFLDAMVNAPKNLWHPCVVFVDEAHQFAPQVGESEALGSVNDLMTRGRKRGYCGVLATQRLSKLHKDAAAEAGNKLIGRCGLDDDMKRGAFELGFTKREEILSLRDLDAGEFYAFGPALSKTVEKVKVGLVQTSHPKIGKRIGTSAPGPTEKIRAKLAQLMDIPQVAQREAQDKESLQNEVRELKFKIRRLEVERGKVAPPTDPVQLRQAEDRAFNRGVSAANKEAEEKVRSLVSTINVLRRGLAEVYTTTSKLIGIEAPMAFKPTELTPVVAPVMRPAPVPSPSPLASRQPTLLDDASSDFGRCEKAILKFLAMRQAKDFSKAQVGAITNYSPTSGGFSNSLSKLKTAGYITFSNGRLAIVQDRIPDVVQILGDDYNAPERSSLESYLGKLGICPRKIYEVLLKSPNETFSKEALGELTEYSPTSGGFNNGISELCTLGLAERSDGGVKLNHELLEDGMMMP